MSSFSPFPSPKKRRCWRVLFQIPKNGLKHRKQKYVKTRREAEIAKSELTMLEEACRLGMASEYQAQTWVQKDYLSEEEAESIFPHYAELIVSKKAMGLTVTDYDIIKNAYEEKSRFKTSTYCPSLSTAPAPLPPTVVITASVLKAE